MAEQDQDRTEQATPFKLREAKKRGQVPKSLEVNSWFVLAACMLVVFIYGDTMIAELAHILRTVFSHSASLNLSPNEFINWLGQIFYAVVVMMSPLIVAIMVVAVLMNFFQTGPIFSFFPLKPDLKKINPVTGFKRIFSKRTVYETIKNLIKLALFSGVVYLFVMNLLPGLLSFMQVDPKVYSFLVLNHVEALMLQLVGVLLLLALIDLVQSRREFSEKMKMSTREVKDEVKRREGDPHVRQKIKELQRENAKRAQSASRVPEADVLITNPTHRAIAIKYDRETMESPQVIAKGAGDLALKMREIARRNQVTIVENKPLARALFKDVALEESIPGLYFAEIAKILVKVYSQQQRPGFNRGVLS